MATGSGIAFWEILKYKVIPDSFLAWFVFSGDLLKHPAPVLTCCLFLVCTVPLFFLALLQARDLKEDRTHTRLALQALVIVVVPTCSLWPSRYIKLASVLRSQIDIPLGVIIEDTINDIIEFRNQSNDLADLLGSGVTVNGHTICINIGWKWWVRCFKWWMLAEESSTGRFRSGCVLGLSDWHHRDTPTPNSSPPDLFSGSSTILTSSTLHPLLCLDCFPRGVIPTLTAGCKVTLEFTAFSPSLGTFSTARVISAIPFMISERPRRRPQPLVSVLKQLSASYGPNIVIDAVSNVSADYERALRHVYKSFSEGQKIRGTWVKVLGINAWRREMFLVALEAALVRRGWIERWAVQVTVE